MAKNNKSLIILGAGYQALEVADFAQSVGFEIKCFSTPENFKEYAKAEPFVSFEDIDNSLLAISAVGAPKTKENLILAWGGSSFTSIISNDCFIVESATFEEGTTVAPGAVVSIDVHLGKHVIVNIGATLSHGVTVGDYTTIGPGSNIAGNVTIGTGSVIGIGATILQNVKIGSNVYVGAGSVVTKNIPDNTMVYGVPAVYVSDVEDGISEL